MRQTILSVVLDVDPQSARHLSDLIEAFKRQQEEAGVETYGRLKDGVPSLHFLSMSIFPGAHYDPIFVIEANFDGSPDAFWSHMEATLADRLRPMLRCCKRPADSYGLAAQDPAPQRLSSGQPRTRAGPDPARAGSLPGHQGRACASQPDSAKPLSGHSGRADPRQAAQRHGAVVSVAGGTGAAENFPD